MLKRGTYLLFFTLMLIWSNSLGQMKFEIPDDAFKNYWYAGKAEIASYDLQQARYGEEHKGHSVLIFVTEDFSKSKQVKLDDPYANRKDAEKVMKLNATRKFNTGIYPYSSMTSVFTPVHIADKPLPLKITTSVQEWCGHVFMQMNLKGNDYLTRSFSYFESEGDKTYEIKAYFPEDNIWNTIRINPNNLPLGEVFMLPSALESRFKHFEPLPTKAYASLSTAREDEKLATYRLEYKKSGRVLKITFTKEFPFRIVGWTESNTQKNTPETRAYIKEYLHTDYWNKNSVKDTIWYNKLGLSQQ